MNLSYLPLTSNFFSLVALTKVNCTQLKSLGKKKLLRRQLFQTTTIGTCSKKKVTSSDCGPFGASKSLNKSFIFRRNFQEVFVLSS